MRDNAKAKTTYPKWRGALVVSTVVVVVLILLGIIHRRDQTAKYYKVYIDFIQVQTADLSYYTEYSEYPVATDNAALIRKLSGDNPRKIEFIRFHASDESIDGALLDPWGTPLQLSIASDGILHARSAGPDKTFGTADDFVRNFNPIDTAAGK